jgi:hypothetical protein
MRLLAKLDVQLYSGDELELAAGTDFVIEDEPKWRKKPDVTKRDWRELIIIHDNGPDCLRLTVDSWKKTMAACGLPYSTTDTYRQPQLGTALVTPSKVAESLEPKASYFNIAVGRGVQGRKPYYRTSVNGSAFIPGAEPKDDEVWQGSVGSCFLLSAAAATVVARPPGSAAHSPHPIRELVEDVGLTNSLYRVNYMDGDKRMSQYVSASVPMVEKTEPGQRTEEIVGVGMRATLDPQFAAWPFALEKASISHNKGVISSAPQAMRWLGLGEPEFVPDLTTVPELFQQGRIIVVCGNNHAYYVSAADDDSLTITDQRTTISNRAKVKSAAPGDEEGLWASLATSAILTNPVKVAKIHLPKLTQFTAYHVQPWSNSRSQS